MSSIEQKRADRTDRRIESMIKQRHAVVVGLRKMEDLLSAAGENTPDQAYDIMQELPERLRPWVSAVISNYDLQKIRARKDFAAFCAQVENDTDDHNKAAQALFSQLTKGQISTAGVTLDQKEGYLILLVQSNADYAHIDNKDVIHETVPNDGMTQPNETYLSTGLFIRHWKLRFLPEHAPDHDKAEAECSAGLVIIRTNNLTESQKENVILHERQHFIHHNLLELFEKAEYIGQKNERGKSYVARDVKDECLAFFREGVFGKEFEETIEKHYQYLFAELKTSERSVELKQLQETLHAVAEAFEANREILSSVSARTTFLYHLLSVPFHQMPQWIAVLGRFYTLRMTEVQKAYPRDLFYLDPEDFKAYDPDLLTQCEQLSGQCRRLQAQLREEIFSSIDEQAVSQKIRQLQNMSEKLYALNEAFEKTMRMQPPPPSKYRR